MCTLWFEERQISTLFIAFLCSIPAWQTLFCTQVQVSGFLLPFLPKCCSFRHMSKTSTFYSTWKKTVRCSPKSYSFLPRWCWLFVFICAISLKISQFCYCSHSSLRQQLKIFTLMKSEHLPSRTSVLYLKEMPFSQTNGNCSVSSHFYHPDSPLNKMLFISISPGLEKAYKRPLKRN